MSLFPSCPPIDCIMRLMTVWRKTGKTIRAAIGSSYNFRFPSFLCFIKVKLFFPLLCVCAILPAKAVLEMTYTVSGGTLHSTHSLTPISPFFCTRNPTTQSKECLAPGSFLMRSGAKSNRCWDILVLRNASGSMLESEKERDRKLMCKFCPELYQPH